MREGIYSKRVGLFFGSFNPIHNGHLILANYFVENTNLDEVWFVVSPHNPLKDKDSLIDDEIRLNLVKLAIEGNNKFIASDVEFFLNKPSYTFNTLNHLNRKHSDIEFVLIIGEDNLECFDKWKNYNEILDNYKIYVYPRPNVQAYKFLEYNNVYLIDAPQIDISSSYIRQCIRNKKSIKYLVPENVRLEIEKRNYYCNI